MYYSTAKKCLLVSTFLEGLIFGGCNPGPKALSAYGWILQESGPYPGFIEKADFEPRIQRLKARLEALETQRQQAAEEVSLQQELRLIIGRLEDFSHNIKQGLDQADWHAQRELIRTLVKQVEIDHHQVNVVFRVEPSPALPELGKDCLQHCGRRDHRSLGGSRRSCLELVSINHTCLQPCPDLPSQAGTGVELLTEGFLVNFIKAFCHVCFQDVFGMVQANVQRSAIRAKAKPETT